MTPSDRNVAPGTPSPGRRRLRTAVVVVAAMIAVLYLVVFFIQLPHMREPDNPAPVYVPLALAYVVGAVLVAVRDRAWVQWTGAAVQVILIALLVWIVVGSATHEGVVFFLDMLWLVVTITAAQVFLIVALVALARGARPAATIG